MFPASQQKNQKKLLLKKLANEKEKVKIRERLEKEDLYHDSCFKIWIFKKHC